MKYFDLTVSAINPGYLYAIHHFHIFYYTKSKYVLYVGEDCLNNNINDNFIDESIEALESNDDFLSTIPLWKNDIESVKGECLWELKNFYVAKQWSDQFYLAKSKIFKDKIYNYSHPWSYRVPAYASNGFDRRVDSYLMCNNKYRLISKKFYFMIISRRGE